MIFIDTETTGLSPGTDQILELAVIDADGDEIINQRFRLTRRESWPDAQRINGIALEDVKDCPTFDEWRDRIQDIIAKAKRIVGYNTYYDLRMLHGEGIIIGRNTRVIDVMADFLEIYGEWSDHHQHYKRQTLATCANFYHFDWGELKAHGAMADAMATKHCYEKMRDKGVYI